MDKGLSLRERERERERERGKTIWNYVKQPDK